MNRITHPRITLQPYILQHSLRMLHPFLIPLTHVIAREPTLGRPVGVGGMCVIVARFVYGLEVEVGHDSVVLSELPGGELGPASL